MAKEKTAPKTIDQEYVSRFPTSQRLYRRAVELFPGGVTHDSRALRPFPVYVTRAQGSKKWDVDGHEIIDYWVGHGSLLLGHNRPEVVEAVREQLGKGTHYGACHELELEWASLVREMVPCAERVKFLNSGTEATLMAIRLARAHTGRKKVLKFQGHFHGWHDYVSVGHLLPFEVPDSVGMPAETLSTTVAVAANDIEAVRAVIESEDVACVILEPSGASFGLIPLKPGFLKELRQVTREKGVVLIFDEVITGFRWAPGGAQEYYGVTPDLATIAKCLAGGLPGGAVVGKAELLEPMEFKDAHWNRYQHIYHPGTFNANPLSAAAGVAALCILHTGEPQVRATGMARLLVEGMNQALKRLDIPGCVYGEASAFHTLAGKNYPEGKEGVDWSFDPAVLMRGMGEAAPKFRRAMLVNGIDTMRASGMLSAAHSEEDIARTVEGFENTMRRLRDEGDI